jgi:hypothetical protein
MIFFYEGRTGDVGVGFKPALPTLPSNSPPTVGSTGILPVP